MANSKISALTAATTPLAGTETLPIVQGGATVKATVANITGSGAYSGSFTTLASTGNTTLGDASADTVTVNGTTTFNASPIISVTDNTNAALRITQLGTGNALLVEDSTNPDSTPTFIDASGNVVIGTLTPTITTYPLFIETGAGVFTSTGTNTAASSPTIATSRRRTSGASVNSGDSLGKFSGFGWDGASFIEASRIETAVDATPGTNDMPGRLIFSTTADGASSVTERMRIDNAGNAYVETGTFWQYAPAPTAKAAATTLTAAELRTGILSTTGTTYTITLPTGTAIDAGWTGAPTTGIGFDWYVVNTATGAITIAVGATGMTSLGSLIVALSTSAHFRLRRTAANTYVLYRLA